MVYAHWGYVNLASLNNRLLADRIETAQTAAFLGRQCSFDGPGRTKEPYRLRVQVGSRTRGHPGAEVRDNVKRLESGKDGVEFGAADGRMVRVSAPVKYMRRHSMSTEKSTFWSRVGHWFRSPGRGAEGLEAGANALGDSTLPDAIDPTGIAVTGDSAGARLTTRFRLGNRETAIERLEEGYNRVIQLIESMQRHMAIQEERSATIADAVSKLAVAMSQTPQTMEQSRALLEALGDRAESQTQSLRRLEESLTQLPHLADAQRETMTLVSHQLDGMRRTTDSVTSTLDGFRTAVDRLGTATQESSAALAQWHEDSALRERRMAELLSEQTKRLTFFSVAAVCAAVAAAVIGLAALLR